MAREAVPEIEGNGRQLIVGVCRHCQQRLHRPQRFLAACPEHTPCTSGIAICKHTISTIWANLSHTAGSLARCKNILSGPGYLFALLWVTEQGRVQK